jgi:type I restriction enzyme, S subunit
MNYKKYLKYKNSNIEYIGDIPDHWEINKIKYLTKISVGLVINPSKYFDENGTVPMITGKNVQVSGLDLSNTHFITNKSNNYLSGTQIFSNDIVTMRVGYAGRSCVVKPSENGINCASIIITRNSKNFDSKFVCYVLNSMVGKTQTTLSQNGMAQQVINMNSWKEFQIPIPSLPEQKQISNFLDKQITLLAKSIQKSKRQIILLEEKRQAVIDHAVTKGLDNSITLVDSNVDWIGDIPDHWEINKIKFTSYVKGRIGWQGLTSQEYTNKGPYLITGTDFKDGQINWDSCHHVEQWRFEQDTKIQIKNDDILITKDGTIGKIAFVSNVPGDTTLNSGVMVVRPIKNHFSSKFLSWVLRSNIFKDFIEYIKSGTTINHLYQEEFGKFIFPIPPNDEQLEINDFLEKELITIDEQIQKSKQRIPLLQEKSSTLVTNVVTGKIDVRKIMR